MKFKIEIEEEFKDCLKKFPELSNEKVELVIEKDEKLSGAMGWMGKRRVVVLFVPAILFDKPKILRPIIFHELSHLIDKKNPDRIFFERADKESQRLWRLLQEADALKCVVEK